MHLVWRRASQLAAAQRAVEHPESAPLSAQPSIPCSHPHPNILTGDLNRSSLEGAPHKEHKLVVGSITGME